MARAHDYKAARSSLPPRTPDGAAKARSAAEGQMLQIAIDGQPWTCCRPSRAALSRSACPIGPTSRRSTSRATSSISTRISQPLNGRCAGARRGCRRRRGGPNNDLPQERQRAHRAGEADFVTAVKAMKANGKYNQYVKTHMDAMNRATPASGSPLTRNAAHRGPAFLPWHREFLRRFEQDLQAEVPGAILPYWDWASDAALADPSPPPPYGGTDLMGGNGDAADGDLVKTGLFAFDPADPNAWTVADDTGADTGAGLQRALASAQPRCRPRPRSTPCRR